MFLVCVGVDGRLVDFDDGRLLFGDVCNLLKVLFFFDMGLMNVECFGD